MAKLIETATAESEDVFVNSVSHRVGLTGRVQDPDGRNLYITFTNKWGTERKLHLNGDEVLCVNACLGRAYEWRAMTRETPTDEDAGCLFIVQWRGKVMPAKWTAAGMFIDPIAWDARLSEVTHWRPFPMPNRD